MKLDVQFFPVRIPNDFLPSDIDRDGADLGPSGKLCPGYQTDFRPRWGGGMRAVRIRDGKRLEHRAIDIMGAEGAEIRSIGRGVVALVWRPGPGRVEPGTGKSLKGGNYVVIDDGPFRWYYAHLRDAPLVHPGEIIEAGDLLGYLGRTGNAVRKVRQKDGSIALRGCPHLHLALTALEPRAASWARGQRAEVLGTKIDPVPFLRPLYEAGGWRK